MNHKLTFKNGNVSSKKTVLISSLMMLLFASLITGLVAAQVNVSSYTDKYLTTESALNSGTVEFSSVAYNPTFNQIAMVDDGKSDTPSRLYIYNVDSDMEPTTQWRDQEIKLYDRRNLDNDTSDNDSDTGLVLGPDGKQLRDFEGIAWVHNNVYALLSEANNKIYFVNMNWDSNDTLVRKPFFIIDTDVSLTGPIGDQDGLEGIAFKFGSIPANGIKYYSDLDDIVFYAVEETTKKVYKIGKNGKIGNPITVSGMSDVSDVYYANGYLYIVSDQSRNVTQFSIVENANGHMTALNQVPNSTLELNNDTDANYRQPEGITFNSNLSKMVIVGETKNNTYDLNNRTIYGVFGP